MPKTGKTTTGSTVMSREITVARIAGLITEAATVGARIRPQVSAFVAEAKARSVAAEIITGTEALEAAVQEGTADNRLPTFYSVICKLVIDQLQHGYTGTASWTIEPEMPGNARVSSDEVRDLTDALLAAGLIHTYPFKTKNGYRQGIRPVAFDLPFVRTSKRDANRPVRFSWD